MKLFSFRIRAISVFIFDTGMSTRRCFDPHALRIRVNMSAIGSVMLIGFLESSRICPSLPRRLSDSGNHPRQGQLAETDATHAEPAEKRPRAAAPGAPIVFAHGELR